MPLFTNPRYGTGLRVHADFGQSDGPGLLFGKVTVVQGGVSFALGPLGLTPRSGCRRRSWGRRRDASRRRRSTAATRSIGGGVLAQVRRGGRRRESRWRCRSSAVGRWMSRGTTAASASARVSTGPQGPQYPVRRVGRLPHPLWPQRRGARDQPDPVRELPPGDLSRAARRSSAGRSARTCRSSASSRCARPTTAGSTATRRSTSGASARRSASAGCASAGRPRAAGAPGGRATGRLSVPPPPDRVPRPPVPPLPRWHGRSRR